MGNRKGLTRRDVVVLLVIIATFYIGATVLLNRMTYMGLRTVCGSNLWGLGTAMLVYAQDYDGAYPQLPGNGPWAKELGFDYYSFGGPQAEAGRTISASFYLLVRQADVSPKSFVCSRSSQVSFEGENPQNLDITELWDFGADPYKHVSYSMHNPYGKYPAHDDMSATFAVAGDMSPWFDGGDIVAPGDKTAPQVITWNKQKTYRHGNSSNHTTNKKMFMFFGPAKSIRTGQNVLFGDGHIAFEKSANCGVGEDNIYTFWSKDEDPSEQDRQGGTNPTARDEGNDARSAEDSFLGI